MIFELSVEITEEGLVRMIRGYRRVVWRRFERIRLQKPAMILVHPAVMKRQEMWVSVTGIIPDVQWERETHG